MKKLLTIALLATVGAASAASIDWTYSLGTKSIKDSDGNKLAGTAYLILANDLADIQAAADPDDASEFLNALEDAKLDKTSISNGKTTATSGTATDKDLVAGNEYDFQVLIYDTAKNQYYCSGTQSQKAYDSTSTDETLAKPTSITLTATDVGATAGTKPNENTWTPATGVPEPATGALALAGIALLFKRRRA